MPRSREVLERFRPVGTPGAAARPGVPADRVAELSAELEPVLALLADVEAECVRRAGREQALRCGQQARERAKSIVSKAAARAGAVRDEAAALSAASPSAWRHR